jgi:hypothetical protein
MRAYLSQLQSQSLLPRLDLPFLYFIANYTSSSIRVSCLTFDIVSWGRGLLKIMAKCQIPGAGTWLGSGDAGAAASYISALRPTSKPTDRLEKRLKRLERFS